MMNRRSLGPQGCSQVLRLFRTFGFRRPGCARAIRAEPTRFAALVTDHTMPRLGGLALVRALRDTAFTGRIVLVSAFLTQEIEEQYRQLGVDQILSKPFNIERLRGALDRALHPNGGARMTARPAARGEGTPLRIRSATASQSRG